MHQPVEQRRNKNHIPEQRCPVFDRTIGGDDGGELLVPTHQHVGKLLPGVRGQAAQEQIVDDEDLGGLQVSAVFLQFTELTGQVYFLDECVRFAIQDFVPALDAEQRKCLRRMALARAGRTDQEYIFSRGDERERLRVPGSARLGSLGL